ncbi:hypothetical protein WJX84_011092 [Apatococcus fuscideae]|uniref:Uncharacterized protein n=1 Tax=Apatococcus fuscideae TaxID=2026836 RepID=A0AAW1SZ32_9CHLO
MGCQRVRQRNSLSGFLPDLPIGSSLVWSGPEAPKSQALAQLQALALCLLLAALLQRRSWKRMGFCKSMASYRQYTHCQCALVLIAIFCDLVQTFSRRNGSHQPMQRIQSGDSTNWFDFQGKIKGEAILEVLSCYAVAQKPIALYLTDGVTYHPLVIKSQELVYHLNLNVAQALSCMVHEIRDNQGVTIHGASPLDAADAADPLRQLRSRGK